MNVIVIDDEPSSLLAFASQIIDNASVTANMFKNNFDDALEFARSKPVKAAFLDIVMPGCNGVDFAEKLIKINPEIKIVFCLTSKETAAQFVQRSLCVVIVFCLRLSPQRRH